MSIVLKEKHSLVGRGVLPIVLELKAATPSEPPFARLKKDHPLEKYKLEELIQEFRKLSGEELPNVLNLAGLPVNLENAIQAVHLAIIQVFDAFTVFPL